MLAEKQITETPPREPYMAFALDDVTAHLLENTIKSKGWNPSRVIPGGLETALTSLCEVQTPELLIIDLSNCDDPVGGIEKLAQICESGVRLICLGNINDVQLYRTLLDMGVDDYLLKPLDAQALTTAIERTTLQETQIFDPEPSFDGQVVSVVGTSGGCGASTFAQNVAWDFAYNKSRKTVLVDLDLHFGTQALCLDLEPGRGFRESLQSPSRIDSLFLERAVVKIDAHFHLLACETDMDQPINFSSDALGTLIEKLQESYEAIVIDVPRALYIENCDVLARNAKTVFISELSLAGMRDSLRLLRFSKKHSAQDDLFIVANRIGENKERELSQKEFETGIEGKVSYTIPYDAKAFAKAEIQGTCLSKSDPKCKASLQIADFCKEIFPPSEASHQKSSFISRFFRKNA